MLTHQACLKPSFHQTTCCMEFIIYYISTFLYYCIYYILYQCGCLVGWQDGQEVRTLTSKLSRLGWTHDPALNCHPSVSQAGWYINTCAIPGMDIKLGVPSAGISWWTLKIPWCPSRKVGELSPAPWPNFKILP